MDIIHGYFPWLLSMDIIHGYYPWILSTDNIHGSYPWILSMDIIHPAGHPARTSGRTSGRISGQISGRTSEGVPAAHPRGGPPPLFKWVPPPVQENRTGPERTDLVQEVTPPHPVQVPGGVVLR